MIGYRILAEHNLMVVCNWGETTLDQIIAMRAAVGIDPNLSLDLDVLADNSRLIVHLETKDIRHLAESRVKGDSALAKMATVAPQDVSFGMYRMYEMMSQGGGAEPTRQMMVFRDLPSAMEWLGKSDFPIQSVLDEIITQASE
tara:strand:+ start:482 stop:910 length:429 start_codon:yes stop_codon:yes gene_type:complete